MKIISNRWSKDIADLFRVRLSAQSAWIELGMATLVNVSGMVLEMLYGRAVPGIPNWPPILAMICGSLILVILVIFRKNPRANWVPTLFLINTFTVVAALSPRSQFYIASVENWFPFQADKLGCFVSALLAPNMRTGILSIGLHVGSSILQLSLFPAEVREKIAFGEPWPAIAFALAGLLTLTSRMRRMKIESEVVTLQLRSEAAARFASHNLRIRDSMNTPLQTIEFSLACLREDANVDRGVIHDIAHSIDLLAKLNVELKNSESHLAWTSNHFDEDQTDQRSPRLTSSFTPVPPGSPSLPNERSP